MKSLTLIAFFMLFFVCVSCKKKYEEDDKKTCKKPTNRLVGNWTINDYTFNGTDVINLINSKTKLFDIRDLNLEITKKSGKIPQHYRFSPYSLLGVNGHDDPLQDNDSKFLFVSAPNPKQFGDSILNYVFITPLSFKGQNYTKWEIKKLYKNSMHLQLITDTGYYDIYFKK